jgi:hypothetical protein
MRNLTAGMQSSSRSSCPSPTAVSSLLCTPGDISILRRQFRRIRCQQGASPQHGLDFSREPGRGTGSLALVVRLKHLIRGAAGRQRRIARALRPLLLSRRRPGPTAALDTGLRRYDDATRQCGTIRLILSIRPPSQSARRKRIRRADGAPHGSATRVGRELLRLPPWSRTNRLPHSSTLVSRHQCCAGGEPSGGFATG